MGPGIRSHNLPRRKKWLRLDFRSRNRNWSRQLLRLGTPWHRLLTMTWDSSSTVKQRLNLITRPFHSPQISFLLINSSTWSHVKSFRMTPGQNKWCWGVAIKSIGSQNLSASGKLSNLVLRQEFKNQKIFLKLGFPKVLTTSSIHNPDSKRFKL